MNSMRRLVQLLLTLAAQASLFWLFGPSATIATAGDADSLDRITAISPIERGNTRNGAATGNLADGEITGRLDQMPAEPSRAATTLTRIDVHKTDDGVTVALIADGEMSYEAKRLNERRVVIDLGKMLTSLPTHLVRVDHPLLRQVRVGQHPDKARLVFDLATTSQYSILPAHNRLVVRLTRGQDEGRQTGSAEGAAKPEADRPLVKVAPSTRVPFPERLAMIAARPAMAQMAPEPKVAD